MLLGWRRPLMGQIRPSSAQFYSKVQRDKDCRPNHLGRFRMIIGLHPIHISKHSEPFFHPCREGKWILLPRKRSNCCAYRSLQLLLARHRWANISLLLFWQQECRIKQDCFGTRLAPNVNSPNHMYLSLSLSLSHTHTHTHIYVYASKPQGKKAGKRKKEKGKQQRVYHGLLSWEWPVGIGGVGTSWMPDPTASVSCFHTNPSTCSCRRNFHASTWRGIHDLIPSRQLAVRICPPRRKIDDTFNRDTSTNERVGWEILLLLFIIIAITQLWRAVTVAKLSLYSRFDVKKESGCSTLDPWLSQASLPRP